MLSLRAQYFLSFAVFGSVMPFLSVFFQEDRGLTKAQVGYVMSAAAVPMMLTPVLVTLLADTRIDARRLMSAVFGLTGAMLAALWFVRGFWPVLIVWAIYNLALAPVVSLQDGINFSIQRRRLAEAKPTLAYHRVRVWGTVGYIVPSVVLYLLLRDGEGLSLILPVAGACCAFGAVNAFWMPDPKLREKPKEESELAQAGGLPTFEAARVLFRGRMLGFTIAAMLTQFAAAAYYLFYPLYLTDVVHIDGRWLGLISSCGVTLEVLVILAYGRLLRRFGYRWMMTFGSACMVARLMLLAAWPTPAVAIGSQVFHGVWVLVVHVMPATYLDRHASDRFRHSIQGLHVILIGGVCRVAANLVAGWVAEISLTAVFAYGAVCCAVAGAILWVTLRGD